MYTNKKTYAYTTQPEIRRAFWEAHPKASRMILPSLDGRLYTTDTRCTFVDYVDSLARDGLISESLAQRVTL